MVVEMPVKRVLEFVASARDDLSALPKAVKQTFGFALEQAVHGERHYDAKPLKGFGGAGVVEIVKDHDRMTYRAVYTVKFKDAVYVLDAFAKKSKQGIKTPKQDMDRIKARLKLAEAHYNENYEKKRQTR